MGAVLSGVTVEAFRPALIEKIRTVVTNGLGRYRPSSCGRNRHRHVHVGRL
jgi:hypothetical protein